jgi:hypothetical protein
MLAILFEMPVKAVDVAFMALTPTCMELFRLIVQILFWEGLAN